jgi:pyruvate kinase
MLSAETSVGAYPVETVRAMAQIAQAAEESPVIHGRARPTRGDTPAAAVMRAAVELADELDAAALIVPTMSGGAARACSKYRRRQPIVALTHGRGVAEQLTLEWGVYPIAMAAADTVEELTEQALMTARDYAQLASGDLVVITGGRQPGTPGATNLIMLREVP